MNRFVAPGYTPEGPAPDRSDFHGKSFSKRLDISGAFTKDQGIFVRACLRASTAEQDATRARAALDAFAASRGFRLAVRYVKHESGTRLARAEIEVRQVRIASLDLPTSCNLIATPDDFTARMFAAVNATMLDVPAAVARKDYDDRRRWQVEGGGRARTAGLYRGLVENTARNASIARWLREGHS